MVFQLIQHALKQRFLILAIGIGVLIAGFWTFRQLPVDAYPDLSDPTVAVVTQWPGHAAEEVERLITVPLETAFNGAPRLKVIRSVSIYGLSEVTMTFETGA